MSTTIAGTPRSRMAAANDSGSPTAFHPAPPTQTTSEEVTAVNGTPPTWMTRETRSRRVRPAGPGVSVSSPRRSATSPTVAIGPPSLVVRAPPRLSALAAVLTTRAQTMSTFPLCDRTFPADVGHKCVTAIRRGFPQVTRSRNRITRAIVQCAHRLTWLMSQLSGEPVTSFFVGVPIPPTHEESLMTEAISRTDKVRTAVDIGARSPTSSSSNRTERSSPPSTRRRTTRSKAFLRAWSRPGG